MRFRSRRHAARTLRHAKRHLRRTGRRIAFRRGPQRIGWRV